MSAYHSVYGLILFANVPIPAVPILENSKDHADVVVWLKEKTHPVPPFSESFTIFYSSKHRNDEGHPIIRVGVLDPNYFVFFYSGGLRFAVARDGREVLGDWPDDYSLEDAATYFVGPILGFILRLRGTLSLHASCVAVDGRAVAFLGPPGAGKSTTAASFAKLGYPIVSEDVVPLTERDNSFFAMPGYPRINLWPSSVEALFGDEDALPVVTPAWGKRFLSLDQRALQFQRGPLPLAAIYLLGRRDSESGVPVIVPLEGMAALMTLVANTYVNYVLDGEMRKHEFDILGRLVSSVPLLSVRPSADSSHLPDLCNRIVEDVRERRSALLAEHVT